MQTFIDAAVAGIDTAPALVGMGAAAASAIVLVVAVFGWGKIKGMFRS